jgi:uncharacterized membrane-anchored protein
MFNSFFNLLSKNAFVKFIYKLFFDSFRDSNSKKFSLSRFLAAALFVMVIWFHVKAIQIMVEKKEVDHTLLLEDFAFISSIIFHKNYINRNNVETGGDNPDPNTPS